MLLTEMIMGLKWLREPVTRRMILQETPDAWAKEFFSHVLPGDELWSFSSEQESWDALAGRAGYCIVRGGKVVFAALTMMS